MSFIIDVGSFVLCNQQDDVRFARFFEKLILMAK